MGAVHVNDPRALGPILCNLTILFVAMLLVVLNCEATSCGLVGFERPLDWIHVQNISLPFTTASATDPLPPLL